MERHVQEKVRDWHRTREMWVRILEKQTGEDVPPPIN